MRAALSSPLAFAAAAALAALSAGCTTYDFVVRVENAPLYADEERTTVRARMKRLDVGHVGHSAPKGDPVEVVYQGIEGFANRSDIRIFSYPRGDDYERWWATAFHRREVALEGRDWPPEIKESIRHNRIQNGMTAEMVELAWGRPSSVRPLPGGGTEWVYERAEWIAWDDVRWRWHPGWSHLYYAYPWGWGVAWDFPHWDPVYYRTYTSRIVRRTVTFDESGRVTGWNERA